MSRNVYIKLPKYIWSVITWSKVMADPVSGWIVWWLIPLNFIVSPLRVRSPFETPTKRMPNRDSIESKIKPQKRTLIFFDFYTSHHGLKIFCTNSSKGGKEVGISHAKVQKKKTFLHLMDILRSKTNFVLEYHRLL